LVRVGEAQGVRVGGGGKQGEFCVPPVTGRGGFGRRSRTKVVTGGGGTDGGDPPLPYPTPVAGAFECHRARRRGPGFLGRPWFFSLVFFFLPPGKPVFGGRRVADGRRLYPWAAKLPDGVRRGSCLTGGLAGALLFPWCRGGGDGEALGQWLVGWVIDGVPPSYAFCRRTAWRCDFLRQVWAAAKRPRWQFRSRTPSRGSLARRPRRLRARPQGPANYCPKKKRRQDDVRMCPAIYYDTSNRLRWKKRGGGSTQSTPGAPYVLNPGRTDV